MIIYQEIDEFMSTAETRISQKTRRQRIKLYGEGLKSKIVQANYALSQIRKFSNRTDTTATSTSPDEIEIAAKVGFYCDAFWAFLYSSLDVLGHVINQSMKLELDEKQVSFKKVASELKAKHENANLTRCVSECCKSNAFKNIEAYRNCSTHRRQIYIEEKVIIVRGTPGYGTTATRPFESVQRIICDNPLVAKPSIKQKRKVPEYLQDSSDKLLKQISKILKNIIPIK